MSEPACARWAANLASFEYMDTAKPRTVYALVLTFEEEAEIKQEIRLWSLKGNADSLRRNFFEAVTRTGDARLFGDTLEKLQVVPILNDDGFGLAAHAVAATWQGETGVEQSIELFEREEQAAEARRRLEQSFENGSRSGLIALTCEKTPIAAPISEGEKPFRSYMDTVNKLRRD
jgi:hypothetical protein